MHDINTSRIKCLKSLSMRFTGENATGGGGFIVRSVMCPTARTSYQHSCEFTKLVVLSKGILGVVPAIDTGSAGIDKAATECPLSIRRCCLCSGWVHSQSTSLKALRVFTCSLSLSNPSIVHLSFFSVIVLAIRGLSPSVCRSSRSMP